MKRFILSLIFINLSILLLAQVGAKDKKIRQLTFTDFHQEFGLDDTSKVVIDIFFDKRDNGAIGEMTFLPISLGVYAIPYTRPLGALLIVISTPIFIHGAYTLVRFRKKRLHNILTNYQSNKDLPNWLKRKVDKRLALYKVIDRDY